MPAHSAAKAEPARYPPVRFGDYLMERIDANYAYGAKANA
jgi:hypothetical protein